MQYAFHNKSKAGRIILVAKFGTKIQAFYPPLMHKSIYCSINFMHFLLSVLITRIGFYKLLCSKHNSSANRKEN